MPTRLIERVREWIQGPPRVRFVEGRALCASDLLRSGSRFECLPGGILERLEASLDTAELEREVERHTPEGKWPTLIEMPPSSIVRFLRADVPRQEASRLTKGLLRFVKGYEGWPVPLRFDTQSGRGRISCLLLIGEQHLHACYDFCLVWDGRGRGYGFSNGGPSIAQDGCSKE